MKNFLENKNSALIFCTIIFLLSIFLRSRMDVGGDSSLNIDLAAKIFHGGKYYYDFFESNFPLTLWITIIPYSIAQFFNISPLIVADIFVDLIGIAALFFSARILKKSTLRSDHQNLLIISFALAFFLRIYALEVNEFVTKGSFLLVLFFPYLSYSLPRITPLTKADLIWRGTCAGLLCCLKPHYIILPLFIESERLWKKRSLKFFLELDKVVMAAVGLIYLILMLKFTPEFFEFIIPMSSISYLSYADPNFFWNSTNNHFISKVTFFGGFFLVFIRQKFTPEDKTLFLAFIASCLTIIAESLGCVDQEATFSALTSFIFIKISYDFVRSKTFDFSQNKLALGFLLILLIWEPYFIATLMKATFFYWVIVAIIIVNFYQDLRDKKVKIGLYPNNLKIPNFFKVFFMKNRDGECKLYQVVQCHSPSEFLQKRRRKSSVSSGCLGINWPPRVILLIMLLTFILLFAFAIRYVETNVILIPITAGIFLTILFFYEKVRKDYSRKFSSVFVFFQLALILSLVVSYLAVIASAYRGQNLFKTPNFLSDNIIAYSKANLAKESDQILIWSYFVSESFPAINSLGKINNSVGNTAGILHSNIGNRFLEREQGDAMNYDFVLNYFFNDLKLKVGNKNTKIIFIDDHYPCKIGFLENYFYDAEFKKIFLENYHFGGRIFLSREIKNNQQILDLPRGETVYDFEIYVRNDEE